MGLFWLGASSAFFAKLLYNKAIRKPYLYKAYHYPTIMLMGGVTMVYYDWYRRLALEYICELEDLNDRQVESRSKMIADPLLKPYDALKSH
ncbi:unnamed protein product [Blepharisma stoltei]|uniref:Uncharacterized protein n=1 Tax=Blepharisma stoltei TaxID=1481888 RepID=A0AAU9K7N7_9CILI|nr:unnamed protein product [Blepharisma stoltei]